MNIENKLRRKFTVNRCILEEASIYGVFIEKSNLENTVELEDDKIVLDIGEEYVGDVVFSSVGEIGYISNICNIRAQLILANNLIGRNEITSPRIKKIIQREISNTMSYSCEAISQIEKKVCELVDTDDYIRRNFRIWLENEIILNKLQDQLSKEQVNCFAEKGTSIKRRPWDLLIQIEEKSSRDKLFELLWGIFLEITDEKKYAIQLAVSYVYNEAVLIYNRPYVKHMELLIRTQQLLSKSNFYITEIEISRYIIGHPDLIFEINHPNDLRIYSLKNWNLKVQLNELIKKLQLRNQIVKDKRYEIADECDQEQAEAVECSLNSPITIITGGAGTGKTYTLQEIMKCFRVQYPSANIKIVAPTGKAMNCIKLRFGNSQDRVEIGTIHRVLGLGTDNKKKKRKLKVELLIIDEASMVSMEYFIHLLSAVLHNDNLHIVVVGDTNQLPPVNAIAVLPELLVDMNISTIRLNTIYRQSSSSVIIENAYKVLDGNSKLTWAKGEFEFYEAKDKQIANKLKEIIMSLTQDKVCIQKQVQIMSATNDDLNGVANINEKIQEVMSGKLTQKFLVGTKVMHTTNNYQKDIFNGEIGVVIKVEVTPTYRNVTVNYQGDKTVNYRNDEIKELKLAFCTTIHKMQGSEEEIVILVVSKKHLSVLDKRKLYVAVTRAREKVIVIGDEKTLCAAIEKQ